MNGCGGCHLADVCAGQPARAPGPYRGTSLVVASLLYFLGPAGLALAGASVAGDGSLQQLAGGLAGLLAGMLIAALAARRHTPSTGREECFEPR